MAKYMAPSTGLITKSVSGSGVPLMNSSTSALYVAPLGVRCWAYILP